MAKPPGAGTPALRALVAAGVAHVVRPYDHDPRATSFGREAAQLLGVPEERVFKTLMTEVDGRPAVAIVPVTGSLDLKALAAALAGKRATMMDVRAAERLTGYVVGGISPLGQRRPSPTVIDATALEFSTILVSGGRRGLDVELAGPDLVALLDAVVAPIAAP